MFPTSAEGRVRAPMESAKKTERFDEGPEPAPVRPASTVLERQSVAAVFLRYLELMEVPFVFGIPGGFIAPFLKLLRRSSSVSFVIGRHETGCAFMADGFSRMTGKPGVVFATAGPGALNALTGISCAQSGQSSVMLVSGQNPTAHFGMGALQESTNDGVNIVEVFRHACAASELVLSDKVLRTRLLQASRLCLGRPRQAVHLSFPLDVSSSTVESIDLPAERRAYALEAPTADPVQLALALDQLVAADNPLVLLGSGAREALRGNALRLASLTSLLSSLAVPVVTSVQGKGIFPESHALSLGVHGICGSSQADAFVRERRPDVLLVVGSGLGEWPTKSWDTAWLPSRTLIQIDVDPRMLGRVYPVQLPILGEAGASLDGLLVQAARRVDRTLPEPLRIQARRERIAAFKRRVSPYTHPERRESPATPLLPQRLMKELNDVIPRQTSLFLDNGNSMAWGIHHLQIDPPTEVYLSTGMSSMGWANGAVIGAKLGAPLRTCICVTGDGSFLMNGAEISTAARYRIGAIWLVLYDNSLGMVNHGEMVTGNHEFPLEDPYYQLGSPDVVGFARALGADGYWIEAPGQLAALFPEVLARANQDGRPQVVAARIDPRELAPILDRFETLTRSGA
jgi:acetolactate synthase-1/2/3 large subunit